MITLQRVSTATDAQTVPPQTTVIDPGQPYIPPSVTAVSETNCTGDADCGGWMWGVCGIQAGLGVLGCIPWALGVPGPGEPFTDPGWVCVIAGQTGDCVTTWTTEVDPGQPYIAPTVVTTPGYTIPASLGLGWTGGARSAQVLPGNAKLEWKVRAGVVGAFVGLSAGDTTAHYSELTHAFRFSHGRYSVWENGAAVPGTDGYYSDGDTFGITRIGGIVTYHHTPV
jgi:hypothetical protein